MLFKILVAILLIIILIAPWMTRDVMDELITEYYPNCDKLGGIDDDSKTTSIASKWFPFGRKITGCNEQPVVISLDPRISAALLVILFLAMMATTQKTHQTIQKVVNFGMTGFIYLNQRLWTTLNQIPKIKVSLTN